MRDSQNEGSLDSRSVDGYIDRNDGCLLVGWVADAKDPGRRLVVDAYLGEVLIGSATADCYRRDLATSGVGDGRYGFCCYLKPRDSSVAPAALTLRVRDTDVILRYQGKSTLELNATVFLKYIAADIVNNCNLRCPFCMVDYRAVSNTELMSEGTFVRLLALIRSVPDGGFWLSCLHEPTLHPQLNRFLELIPPDCRRKVFFTTNLARPLAEDVFAGWADSGIHHVNVSLDTMKPDLFAVLRRYGRYPVFKANLDNMVKVFRRSPNAPKIRYITLAFKSNIDEIPSIVEYSHRHWLSSENEIRYTYNVSNITDEFRRQEYLDKGQWVALSRALDCLPYHFVIAFPPNNHQETIQPSANYFDLNQIDHPSTRPMFDPPLSLRARPDGTLMVANKERQFKVNIHSLTDPVHFFRELSCGR